MNAFHDISYQNAYLPNVGAVVITESNTRQLVKDATEAATLTIGKKEFKYIPWGTNNDFPLTLQNQVYKNPVLSSNMLFNILISNSNGVKPFVKVPLVSGEIKFVELESATVYLNNLIDTTTNEAIKAIYNTILSEVTASIEEINLFIDNNDLDNFLLESLTDMHWFFNVFPVLQFNQADGKKRKLAGLYVREASFSRFSKTNDNGEIEYHFYNKDWAGERETITEENTIITPVLDPHNPVRKLQIINEIEASKSLNSRRNEFVLPINLPTPGRNYYQKPYYYSIFESGWFDFAQTIPEIKKALMINAMRINYVVRLDEKYFETIFDRENISDEKKKLERVKKEYTDINDYLAGHKNSNKALFTITRRDLKGQAYPNIEVEVIDNKKQGNEFIEDSEEVSNIMSYGMLVHPSIVGSAPGKNKAINGTEARELLIIKQIMLNPFVNRVLRPLYVISKFNNWPRSLVWLVPKTALTTLDKSKTGQTQITEQ